jgi:hypothetical protein
MNNLKDQGVTEIYTVKKVFQGVQKPTGTYFLTFSTTKIPEEIKVAYLNVKVTAYVPEPTRCFNCLQYGHISKFCPKKEERLCINCSAPHHTEEEETCSNPPKCIHCPGKHNSISRDCPKYIQQKSILKIKATESVSFPEAAKRYRMMNPTLPNQRTSYASQLQTKTCNCACTCKTNIPSTSPSIAATTTPSISPSIAATTTPSTSPSITATTTPAAITKTIQQSNKTKHHGSTSSSDIIPTKMKKNATGSNTQESDSSDSYEMQ